MFLLAEHVPGHVNHRGADVHAAQVDAEVQLVALHDRALARS